jgi:hypothetical protein
MQAPPFVLQHTQQLMAETFMPTTRAAILRTIEMLAKPATLWFSKLFFYRKSLIRPLNSVDAKAEGRETRKTSCKSQEIRQLSPKQ